MQPTVVVGLLAVVMACASADLTPADKQSILDQHNLLRRTLAKGQAKDGKGNALQPAADMSLMIWDDTIAAAAQTFVSGCPGGHDANRGPVGENYASGTTGAYSYVDFTNMWYNEMTSTAMGAAGYLPCDPSAYNGACYDGSAGMIGHASQLIWAQSWKLGCGAAQNCNGNTQLICRYSAAGNMKDAKIYTAGSACSACLSTQTCSDGLCSGNPVACVDFDQFQCGSFVKSGYCTGGAYQSYVQGKCPKACGLC